MKGIILAGGTGSRLYPITNATCKQLLPVYDKPMIYYPLSTLMMAGIKDIMIICRLQDLAIFEDLIGNGHHLGLDIIYQVQNKPEGIAQSFVIAEDFIKGENVCLILGDNLFHGAGLDDILKQCTKKHHGALIFGYPVMDPSRYGVINYNDMDEVINIIEKPIVPPSNYAVPGLYFFDQQVAEIAKGLEKSERGEYEITEVINEYIRMGICRVKRLDRGFCWMDTGTHESLAQASNYIQAIQERQGLMVGCIEETAYRLGYLSRADLKDLVMAMPLNDYGRYLEQLL